MDEVNEIVFFLLKFVWDKMVNNFVRHQFESMFLSWRYIMNECRGSPPKSE